MQRPEKRSVVIAVACFGKRALGIGVGNEFGERLLKQVLCADAKHYHVQSALHDPVDLTFPILEAPVLRLEAVQAPMGKVAQSSQLEIRLCADAQVFHGDAVHLRDDISIPEIPASCLEIEEIVHGVQGAAPSAPGQKENGSTLPLNAEDRVAVASRGEPPFREPALEKRIAGKGVHIIRADHNEVLFAVFAACDAGAGDGGVQAAKFSRGDVIGFWGVFRLQDPHTPPPGINSV